MENASKALLIAGAILLCILLIAIGMYIYNSAQSTITDSLTSMSTQEIEAFNNNFTTYDGAQTGSQVKSLIGRLIANADTYRDEPAKVPAFQIDQISNTTSTGEDVIFDTAGNPQDYVDRLSAVRNKIETKHEYWIEMSYQNNGIIDYVVITYDSANPNPNASTTHR